MAAASQTVLNTAHTLTMLGLCWEKGFTTHVKHEEDSMATLLGISLALATRGGSHIDCFPRDRSGLGRVL